MQTRSKISKLLAAFLTSSVLMAPAYAEPAQEGAYGGDIIVTATRRAQALSDVPIAVSAISADQLGNSGTTDIRSLNQLAPSLLVSGATNELSFSARVRGVGTVGENPGLESSVALFVDGVYRSRTGTGLSDLGEVERIEVLRGPQGTLFGRNASAGLINVVTKKPAFENYVYANGTYGNYNQIRLEGGVNMVVSEDKLAAKIEGLWNKRDGYVEDVVSDRRFNDRNRWMLRGQVLWEPSADLSIRLIGDYARHREECCVPAVGPSPSMTLDSDGNVVKIPNTLLPILRGLGSQIQPGEQFKAAITPARGSRADTDQWGVSGEINWDLGPMNLTSITAYRDFKNRTGTDADFNNLDLLWRDNAFRHFKTFSQEIRLQGTLFEDRLDWLVGGYYSDEKMRIEDEMYFGEDIERFGDCLIVASLAPDTLNTSLPRCTSMPATVWPGYAGLATALGAARLPGTGASGGFWQHDSRNFALFTHNSFEIVPNSLTLTVGARYTNERKTIDSAFNFNNTLCTTLRNMANAAAALPCAINSTAGPGFTKGEPGTEIKESRWTGTAVLSWKPTDGLMVYGSWARGYKAGGFNLDASAVDPTCNPLAGTPAQQAACSAQLALPINTVSNGRPEASDLQFAAETVNAYELGAKFTRPGFSANLALFKQEFSNFQFNTYNGVNFEVTSLQGCKDDLGGADSDTSALTGGCDVDRLKPGLVSKGLEIEFMARPVEDLSFTQAMTYASTKLSENLVGTNGRPLSPVLFQIPGQQMSNSPRYVLTGSASWTPMINNDLRATFYLDYRFQDDTNTGSDLDREKVQPSYIIFNGRIGISSVDKRWGLELWGQNLFNKEYFQIGADMPLQGGGTFNSVADGRTLISNQMNVIFPGEPRTFGVTARMRF